MPDIEEEEEVEQQSGSKNSGRSAFFAGVHAADGFGGAYRGVKSAPHGGAATVKDEDTLGSGVRCWCGDMFGHDWPGKSAGRKHPREEKQMATAAEVHDDHFDPSLLKSFDKRVARMVGDLANQFGVRVRMIDGSHAMLYPLDSSRPFKIAAARPAEQTLDFLEKFAHNHVAPELVGKQVELLAARFNDPTKKRRVRAVKAVVAPEPTPDPDGPLDPVEDPVQPGSGDVTTSEAPPGYHQHFSQEGKATNWWESDDGGHWVCKEGDYETTNLQRHAAHQRMHSQTAEERSEQTRKANAARDPNREGKRLRARNAIEMLIEDYDLGRVFLQRSKVNDASPQAEKKIAALEAKLAKITAERDEYKAKLDLMKEAFSA